MSHEITVPLSTAEDQEINRRKLGEVFVEHDGGNPRWIPL